MPKFDVVEAAMAGFGLIGRKPLAVLAWGMVMFVLSVLPLTLLIGPWVTVMSETFSNMQGGPPTPEKIEAMQTRFMMLGPMGNLVQLLSLVGRAIVGAAICRAIISPNDDRFAYLRLGKSELFLGLVVLAGAIMLGLGVAVVAMIGVALGFAVAGISESALAIYAVVASLALIVALFWLLLRFSLSGPMSVAEKNFRLFESWPLTRGHVLSLFLVGLLNFIVVMVLEMVVMALIGGVLVAVVVSHGGMMNESAIEAFFRQPPADIARLATPWLIGAGFIGSILGSALFAVMLAPWAHVYKALSTKPAEAF